MDIDSRSLELLEAIASDGTLTAASSRLHVSQPALSQRLSTLERRLGLALFDRQGRRLVPTQAGRRLLKTTNAVLAELRAASRDLDDLRSGRTGVLRFTSQCSTNLHFLPPIIREFGERCPGVEVRIDTSSAEQPVDALLDDRLDVALISKPDRRLEALDVHPLFDDAMVAVVPPDHEWAGRPFVDAADFDGINLIVFESYDPARSPTMPLPIPPGAHPTRVIPTPVISELAIEMVVAGQGIAVLPGWLMETYVRSGRVATVSITERPDRRQWSCATQRQPSPAVATFVDIVRAHMAAAD